MRRIWLIFLTFCGTLSLFTGCSAHRLFYLPNRYLYSDPAIRGMPYEMVNIPSSNRKQLSAIIFRAVGQPKGTVVHCHGNFGNVSCHYSGSQFLTRYGFDVLVFDYQGYGASEGNPSPKNTIEDGRAVVRYAQENLRDPKTGVLLFGQSLGGAIAAVVAAKDPLVKAVVLEAPFYSYRSIARATLKKSILTWPLYPILPLFLGSSFDPWRYVKLISPRPLLIVHGDKDKIVPHWMGEKLFKLAHEPKEIVIVKGAGHLGCRSQLKEEYEKKIADFFERALQK